MPRRRPRPTAPLLAPLLGLVAGASLLMAFPGGARATESGAAASADLTAGPTVSSPLETGPAPTLSGGAVNGLYSFWEQTGVLHEAGSYQIGYHHAQIGFGPVQLGTQPFLAAYGTYNAQAKLALHRGSRLRIAANLGVYRLPQNAQSQTIGNLNATSYSNPYASSWLYPVSMAASAALTRRIQLHLATTVLTMRSDDHRDRHVSAGQSLMLELRPVPRWAARVHLGAEGIGVATQTHTGISFAYHGDYLQLAAGYVRRNAKGEKRGYLLFDGALLFQ